MLQQHNFNETKNKIMNNEENTPNEEAEEPAIEGEATEAPTEDVAAPAEPTAEAQVADLKDKLLRQIAESENVRKRAERQVSEAASYAISNFAREMLAVSDNLRRALDTLGEDAAQNDDIKAFLEGVEMTERELLNIFERVGIEKIVPVGEKFDHNFHQAMFEIEHTDAAPGTIMQVIQPGYVLKERLLRPAMVGVAKAAKKDSESVDETV